MKKQLVALLALAAITAGLALGGCSASTGGAKTTAPTKAAASSTADADGDGLPDGTEVLLGTDQNNPDTDGDGQNDKVDTAPLQADNPITETATTQSFKIDSVLAENNVDAGGADAPDHLELTVTNTGAADITNGWDLYYTLTDTKTGDVQSFYMPLPGFSLKAGETVHLHVDTSGEPGHFRADPNSSFYTGQNATKIQVTLHAAGFTPQTSSVQKDAAGAEAGGD